MSKKVRKMKNFEVRDSVDNMSEVFKTSDILSNK